MPPREIAPGREWRPKSGALRCSHRRARAVNFQPCDSSYLLSRVFALVVRFFFCAAIGGALGCLAGYFSGTWIDELVIWIYTCLDCIPFYLFVAAVAFALSGNPFAMHIAMIATFWTATARVIRGEVIKLKNFEFVEAARAIGTPQSKIIFRHILPNTFHILLISATIAFVAAIKSEVILSFLGLGVKEGISWGLMISEASSEIIAGHLSNFLAASGFMFVLVIGFNIFSDALQDALDPKKVA